MNLPPESVRDAQRLISGGGRGLFRALPTVLRRIIEDSEWTGVTDRDGQPFSTFEAFVAARLPYGLETTVEDILHFCRAEPEVQSLIRDAIGAAARPGNPTGANQHTVEAERKGNNIPVPNNAPRGTSSSHALRRLKRDNPALAAQVVAGTLSAHAAAVQAGIRSPRLTLTASMTPAHMVARIRAVLGEDALCGIRAALLRGAED